MSRKGKSSAASDKAAENFATAYARLRAHPLFGPLLTHTRGWWYGHEQPDYPDHGWALVTSDGVITVHPKRHGDAEEWLYVLAHCALHLGFDHFQAHADTRAWNAACDVVVACFLADLKLGRPPHDVDLPREWPGWDEERLYATFVERGIPPEFAALGTAGPGVLDMTAARRDRASRYFQGQKVDWPALFGQGLSLAVTSAVRVAGGVEEYLGAQRGSTSPAQRARDWFISSYPLLGALAAGFRIVEDPLLCQRMSISVAAVDIEGKEIYINPAAGLDEHECRFVMAHELLHVGLRHDVRCQGREPWYWNVACDYVINAWLIQMGVGAIPAIGLLHDPQFEGESAEAVYDRIVTDLRRYRKLASLRGVGLGDILEPREADWWVRGAGMELDEFYRRCLAQGLTYHEYAGRGLLPAGLVEEIRALGQPPIPWDVELAAWFDEWFPPLERRRSFARPSRRQSATPDIPRPRYVPADDALAARTFGVVLDTSGSMDRTLLAKALGAIASYSIARDVPAVRVVFCDATAYDQGYLPPEAIAGRVRVRGRGGTVLQPGVDLLERADDFPKTGPLLIITDGFCDIVRVRRPHAFLMPKGRRLPFAPRGQVFRLS